MLLLYYWSCLFFVFYFCVHPGQSRNINASNHFLPVLISKYAKVAHWGAISNSSSTTTTSTEKATTSVTQSEGRSSKGQSFWTHRSDAKVVNRSQKPSVVYHYASSVKSGGNDNKKSEVLPGIGEVIQERFNPKPYFDYANVPSKIVNNNGKTVGAVDAKIPDPPSFDNFPVFSSSKPDLYTSGFNSYNPPQMPSMVDAPPSGSQIAYPPNAPPPPSDHATYAQSESGDGSDSTKDSDIPYGSPEDPEGPPQAYGPSGPPLPPDNQDHDDDGHIYYPPSDDGHHRPEVILDHPPPGWEDKPDDAMMPQSDPQSSATKMKPDMMMMPTHNMAEDDLSPPPSDPSYDGRIPQYLYSDPHANHDLESFYDHDHHHVYKEVTTEAPEKERVNKGHYSYYYLGRKLWYIPLYFSIYFIIYVTVLILKSIARHKVDFKHNHLTFKRQSRKFDNEIDDLERNVTSAIDTSRRKFQYIAM